jgi:hypothetical protein
MGAMQAAFVKFFGRAGTRTAWDAPVLDVLVPTRAHWAGTYPAGRRPRSMRDGDRMFRVHDGEFVAGTLADAVSLGELMDALGAEAFWSTQRNALAGHGNVDPRAAYRQQPAVQLSHEGRRWLDARLDEALARVWRLEADALARLDWPDGRQSVVRRRARGAREPARGSSGPR